MNGHHQSNIDRGGVFSSIRRRAIVFIIYNAMQNLMTKYFQKLINLVPCVTQGI